MKLSTVLTDIKSAEEFIEMNKLGIGEYEIIVVWRED